MFRNSFILIILFISTYFSCSKKSDLYDTVLFSSISFKETGIDFTNTLKADRRLNIVDFNGYYNGGGVAIGDINNDGLLDIYFTSNRGKNKLFLNKGNLKFEDITNNAGVGGLSEWSTGVTMVDINADGYLDIYVCAVTKFKGLRGHNELYINNGDTTFSESSKKWGLDYQTYSCQSVFFDYDHDGDLDCFIVNMSHERSMILRDSKVRKGFNPQTGDILLRNDGNRFIEVSKEANIYQSEIGFGLAVAVADFNDDGWEDIYVSNDFFENDYLYINQQDGTFKESGERYFDHMSRFSMGADASDINNDGYIDLFTLDMAPENEIVEKTTLGEEPYDTFQFKLKYGYLNQYGRNCLQLNNAGKNFSDIAMLSHMEATDWSWSPLIEDFDNDGNKDIFITNGIVKRPNDLDLLNYLEDYLGKTKTEINLPQYYKNYHDKMPIGTSHDYMYKGDGNLFFKDKSMSWGFNEPTISNGASYADLDNDGDVELVINRINRPALFYKNLSREKLQTNFINVKLFGNSNNLNGIGAKVYVSSGSKTQMKQVITSRGFLSSVSPDSHFGLGSNSKIDSLWVRWNDGTTTKKYNVSINSDIILRKEDSKVLSNALKNLQDYEVNVLNTNIDYKHQENNYSDFQNEELIPFKVSTEGPAIVVGDANKDGLEDVFLGGAKHQPAEVWLQTIEGKFKKSINPVFYEDKLFEDVDAVFFDADNDGDEDLYVSSGGNEKSKELLRNRLYLNDGIGKFSKELSSLPINEINTSCVVACDLNNDGAVDLFVGGRSVPGSYGLPASSYVLVNNGFGKFFDETNNMLPELNNLGLVTDGLWEDMDGDNIKDLVIVGEFMPIRIYYNRSGRFESAIIKNTEGQSLNGLWHTIEAKDFDDDGDLDLFIGNLGLNSRFKKNNGNGNIKMYVNDFNKNGSYQQVVCYNREDKWMPISSRDELGKLIPILKKRFPSYLDFAGKGYKEIFFKEERLNEIELNCNTLASMYIENIGKGEFVSHVLPIESQLSTIYSFIIDDFNNDQRLDVLGAGNLYGVSTYQSRYDSGKGFLLFGGYNEKTFNRTISSLNLKGEIRKIVPITISKKKYLIIASNNEKIKIIEFLDCDQVE